MPEWLVFHYNEHGEPVGSFKPTIQNLAWDIIEGVSIKYTIARTDPQLTRDSFAPKRTTWVLHNYGNVVDGGIHSNRNLKMNRDSVTVEGKSYLWYLDNRHYPFDVRFFRPYSPGRQHKWTGVTRKSIIEDLVEATYLNLVPNPVTASGFFASSYGYQILVSGDNGGTTNYQFDFGDSQSILQHIKNLADAEDGFDYRFNPNTLTLELGSPSFDTGTDVFSFDSSDPMESNALIDIEWDDDGPEATFTTGIGAGTQGKPSMGWLSTYEPSLQTYHRWDKVEDIGTVKNLIEMKTQTASRGFLQRFPMKRITVVVDADPNILSGFWTVTRPRNLIGQRFHVKHDFDPYHLVDSSYIITNISLDCKPSGDVLATLTGDIVNT